MRRMLPVYVCVGFGLIAGLFIGTVVMDFEPALVGWIFGAGAGLSVGAFVAALATNTPLAGRGTTTRRPVTLDDFEGEGDPDDVDDYTLSRNGHGSNGSTSREDSVRR
jgi:hypothetical protein